VTRDNGEHVQAVIVDNGSTDQTALILKNWQRSERSPAQRVVVTLPKNEGFAGGNNIGLSKCWKADYYMFVNNDVVWNENPYTTLIKEYSAYVNKDRRVLMGPTVYRHDTGWNMLCGKIVPYVEGWLLFMNRKVMKDLLISPNRIFDEENFPLGSFEDVDLSLRAMMSGIELVGIECSPARHLGSRTSFHTPGFDYVARAKLNQKSFQKKWAHLTGEEWG